MFYNHYENGWSLINVFQVTRSNGSSPSSLRNHVALSYRIHGSAVFEHNDSHIVADTGSIAYIPPQIRYKRSSSEEELIILHLHCTNLPEQEIQILPAQEYSFLSGYFFKILKTWQQHAPGYRHQCTAILYNLFAELEAYDWSNSLSGSQRIIQKSLSYMNTHYSDPQISIAEIAGQSNISEVYFRRLYKDIYGISPCKALQSMRLEQAKELLLSGYFSVNEVAEKCGFENVKYFSTLFRKTMGLPPSQLKQ